MKDYDRSMPHRLKELQVKRRRLVPKNKLLRILDHVFVPSSIRRETIQKFRDLGENKEELAKKMYGIEGIINDYSIETVRLAIYGFLVYNLFK